MHQSYRNPWGRGGREEGGGERGEGRGGRGEGEGEREVDMMQHHDICTLSDASALQWWNVHWNYVTAVCWECKQEKETVDGVYTT